jgi:hypothetical protein
MSINIELTRDFWLSQPLLRWNVLLMGDNVAKRVGDFINHKTHLISLFNMVSRKCIYN